jgi:hypothetical protein
MPYMKQMELPLLDYLLEKKLLFHHHFTLYLFIQHFLYIILPYQPNLLVFPDSYMLELLPYLMHSLLSKLSHFLHLFFIDYIPAVSLFAMSFV